MHKIINSIYTFIKNNWLPLAIISVGVMIQLFFLTRSFNFLLTNIIPDDAFYYFQIARNIVTGHGSTFDGIHATNGYHPLWLLILLPIFKFFSVGGTLDFTPVYLTLSLEIICNTIAGVVMLVILSRYTHKQWLKAFALMLWFLNPFMIYEMMNGLETGLSLMLVALFFLCTLNVQKNASRKNIIIASIVGGLMVLARIDNIFFLAFFYLWLWSKDFSFNHFKKVFGFGLISLLVISPFFLWNIFGFHMLLTSASEGNTRVSHQLIVQDHGTSLFQTAKAAVYSTHYQIVELLTRSGVPAGILILIGMGLGYWLIKKQGTIETRVAYLNVELFLFAGFLTNFLANSAIRWVGRPWYFVAFTIFVMIFVVWLFEQFFDALTYKKIFISVGVAFLLFSFYVNWSKNLKNQYVLQSQMFEAAHWMNTHLPQDAVIGSFNTGIEGYFSRNRVINLDGLVNNSIGEAFKQKKIWSYIKAQKIGYISDFDIYLSYRYKSFIDNTDVFNSLTLVHQMTEDENASRVLKIYKVK